MGSKFFIKREKQTAVAPKDAVLQVHPDPLIPNNPFIYNCLAAW